MFTSKVTGLWPTKADFKHMLPAVLRGTTLGSALEMQPWLQTLEEEVQHTEADALLPSEAGQVDGPPGARIPIKLEDIQQQLTIWEKPLEEPKPKTD